MKQVWRCQWMTDEKLREWRGLGVPMLTAEKLEKNMQAIYDLGFEAGERRGRCNLRVDIETGRVSPIEPNA